VKIKGAQSLIAAFRRCSKADLLIAGDGIYEPELRSSPTGCPTCIFSVAFTRTSSGAVPGRNRRSRFVDGVKPSVSSHSRPSGSGHR
jgi:hypothetical protein